MFGGLYLPQLYRRVASAVCLDTGVGGMLETAVGGGMLDTAVGGGMFGYGM